MPLSRIVTLVIGLIIILGLALWLIDSLSRLYWQLSYSPLLGNLLLFLLVILLVGLVAAFIYYVLILPWLFVPFLIMAAAPFAGAAFFWLGFGYLSHLLADS
ncbi:MAG: hypothetical protein ACKO5O_08065, partial [Cylindrospermopsis raciborskii]